MKQVLLKSCFFIMITLLGIKSFAQQPMFQDTLLDHLTGNWILTGTIAGKQTTHDVTAEWVINHQYLKIHEVSREKNAKGEPAYEADVYIAWQQATGKYCCVWLDVYGGMSQESLGTAVKSGNNQIPFIFPGTDAIFHTTFKYDPSGNTWNWDMKSEDKGVFEPFANVVLKRIPTTTN